MTATLPQPPAPPKPPRHLCATGKLLYDDWEYAMQEHNREEIYKSMCNYFRHINGDSEHDLCPHCTNYGSDE